MLTEHNITSLATSLGDTVTASIKLRERLTTIQEVSPKLFPKPVEDMSISELVKTAQGVQQLITEVVALRPPQRPEAEEQDTHQ